MDIGADLSSLQNRIAQITGAPAVAAAPAPPVPPSAASPASGAGIDGLPVFGPGGLSASSAGPFAGLVAEALAAAQGGTASAQPELGALDGAPHPLPPAELSALVDRNASTWQVDPALVKAVIANESAFDPSATSNVGAQGLMQLMPETAASMGVRDAYDPAQNVAGGTRYLRSLLDRFGGNVRLAVAAYNAGPGAVEKYGGVPPYAETQNYVANVLGSYEQYRNPAQ